MSVYVPQVEKGEECETVYKAYTSLPKSGKCHPLPGVLLEIGTEGTCEGVR